MPQTRLPFFPDDIELINNYIGVQKKNGIVYYFNGAMPVFQHPENDYPSFRLFTSQLVVNGNVKQAVVLVPLASQKSVLNDRLNAIRNRGRKGFMHPGKPVEPAY